MRFVVETEEEANWLMELWPGAEIAIGMDVETGDWAQALTPPSLPCPMRISEMRSYDLVTDYIYWNDRIPVRRGATQDVGFAASYQNFFDTYISQAQVAGSRPARSLADLLNVAIPRQAVHKATIEPLPLP